MDQNTTVQSLNTRSARALSPLGMEALQRLSSQSLVKDPNKNSRSDGIPQSSGKLGVAALYECGYQDTDWCDDGNNGYEIDLPEITVTDSGDNSNGGDEPSNVPSDSGSPPVDNGGSDGRSGEATYVNGSIEGIDGDIDNMREMTIAVSSLSGKVTFSGALVGWNYNSTNNVSRCTFLDKAQDYKFLLDYQGNYCPDGYIGY